MVTEFKRMQQRGASEADILTSDEVPLAREILVASDTGAFWVGNGVDLPVDLPKQGPVSADEVTGLVELPDGTRVPSISPETQQLPGVVRAALAQNLADPTTPEGSAVAGAATGLPFDAETGLYLGSSDDPIPSVGRDTNQLPDVVRLRLAGNISDPETPEGAAAAAIAGKPGPAGPAGPQGLPGTNAVPSDTAVAGYMTTAGTSATKDALSAITGSSTTDTGNGYAWAVVDQAGSVSELAVDLTGQVPNGTMARWSQRLLPLIDALTKSRLDTLVAYGDSLTEAGQGGGPTWETTLQSFRGRGSVANRGVSGQDSGTIAIRQGGAVLRLTAGVTVPADTSAVTVSFQSSVVPLNNRTDASNVVTGSLGGVLGTFKITANTAATGAVSGTFTPSTAAGSTTAVPANTAFVPQYATQDREAAQIFWTGRNDVAFAGATTASGVVAATAAMVAYLAGAVTIPRYLVISVTSSQSETTGTAGYAAVKALNAALAASFPNNYVDLLSEIKANGLAKCGITPTADDLTALAGDTIPPSLTVDGLHFTDTCRTNVIAPFIARQLALRGWN